MNGTTPVTIETVVGSEIAFDGDDLDRLTINVVGRRAMEYGCLVVPLCSSMTKRHKCHEAAVNGGGLLGHEATVAYLCENVAIAFTGVRSAMCGRGDRENTMQRVHNTARIYAVKIKW